MIKKHVKILRAAGLVFAFIGVCCEFLAGYFSADAKLEKNAEYAAEVVNNNTDKKKLCAFTVEKTQDSGAIADHDSEFHNLYGVFKQEKITFASVINPDKHHKIILGDNFSDNLSMLYVGPVGSSPYKNHFKHYTYPIEIMFRDSKMYSINKYIAYISQNHADLILDSRVFKRDANGVYNSDDYQSLLKTTIPFSIDGENVDFVIQNIYYQTNYYYRGLNDTIGDFVIVSYYLPNDLRSEQKNLYFMSEYPYQNKYFMKYIKSVYPSKNYKVSVNRYNIVGEIDEKALTDFYYSSDVNSNVVSTSFILIAMLFIVLSIVLNIYNLSKTKRKKLFLLLIVVSLFVPYSLFYSLSHIGLNIFLFSEFSTKLVLFTFIGYFLTFFAVIAVKKWRKRISHNIIYFNDDNYEISI